MRFDNTCTCCGDLLLNRFSRRRFLIGAGATGLAATLPAFAFAASGNYEAMLLGCIDPRLHQPMDRYTARRRLTGKFSQFIIAGATIGVVAEPFKDWHKAYWDNVNASVQLHNIKRVIAINHRDCGAAKIAYGADSVANRPTETKTHRTALAEFRKQMGERLPQLKVETGLMDLRGRIEMFA
jgi:carbonic anhydrase